MQQHATSPQESVVKKNKTVAYIDSLSDSAKKEVVEWAIGASRKRVNQR